MASRSYTFPSKIGRGQATQETHEGASPAYMAQVLGIKRVYSTIPLASQSAKKRKGSKIVKDEDGKDEDAFGAQDTLAGITSKPKRAVRKKGEEKRLRAFRKKAPLSYLERLDRVKTQRMFLIDRRRSYSADGTHEEEVFDLAGTTGNIYRVTVTKQPHCTCPDGGKGNQCKHIIYVMVNVLKAREDLGYQLALLSTELTEIFANAPPTPQSSSERTTSTDTGGQRKPIEGDCPVCVMAFDAGDDVIWCKGACGNNIHRECFEKWAKSKPGEVICVYCRTQWKGDEDTIKRIVKGGAGHVNHEGYVNVGAELGLSSERDMSTYHPFWVAQQFGDRGFGRSRAGSSRSSSSRPQNQPAGNSGAQQSQDFARGRIYAGEEMPDEFRQPGEIPEGSILRGDVYISPYGGIYSKRDGHYNGCDLENPRIHPDVPAGSEWDGNVWMSDEGGCYSVDGVYVCEY